MSAEPSGGEGVWEAVTDKETGKVYYAHSKTLETRWDPPPGIQIVPAAAAPEGDSGGRAGDSEDDGEGQLVEELSNGWAKLWDPISNKHYYANKLTGETQWTPPVELGLSVEAAKSSNPKDYERVFDEDSGRHYYVHKERLTVQWDAPPGWEPPDPSVPSPVRPSVAPARLILLDPGEGGKITKESRADGESKAASDLDSPQKEGSQADPSGDCPEDDAKGHALSSISHQLRRNSDDGDHKDDKESDDEGENSDEMPDQDTPMTPRKGGKNLPGYKPKGMQAPLRLGGASKGVAGSPPPIPDHLKKKMHPPPRPITPRELASIPADDKDGAPAALPTGLKKEIEKFKLSGFASRHFRTVRNRKGLKQNTVSVDKILCFQSTQIKKSLLYSAKKFNEKAIKLFKYVMQFMGDLPTKRSLGELAQLIVSTGFQMPQLRDEIFCQISKQLTANQKLPSVLQGWKLMALCVSSFPPSRDFQDYLSNYIAQNYDGSEYEPIKGKELIGILAPWCFWRLNKTIMDGGAQHQLTLMDVDRLIQAGPPSYSVTFGASLEYIMQLQKSEGAELKYPAILPVLCDSIKQLGGYQTKGIFRIAAEKSNITQLKQQLERGDMIIRMKSCHVPADVLKIFLRELREPLVPYEKYSECTTACDDPVKCLNIALSLPDNNRNTLSYLLDFLAELATHADETSMAPENIAIVFCSDILRPAKEHSPAEQLKFAAKEKIFVRHLVEAWLEKMQTDGRLPVLVEPKDGKQAQPQPQVSSSASESASSSSSSS